MSGGIEYGKILTEAYTKVFGEAPSKASRAIYYGGCNGGYVKIFPGPKGMKYFDGIQEQYEYTQAGQDGIKQNPKLARIVKIADKLINEKACFKDDFVKSTTILFRQHGPSNGGESFIDMMSDDFVSPSSSY